MNQSRIMKYGVWLLPPLIVAAAMLAFLLVRDSGGDTFTPPAVVGEQDLPGTPVAAEKIQEARDFKDWPLWWLGESFDSLHLTYIDQFTEKRGFSRMNFVSFGYGTCTPRPDAGGCGLPLEIQVDPLCFTPPERITGVEREDTFEFRGARALWVDDHLRIWTGDSAIAIFGSHDRILRAADALRPLGNIPVTLIDSRLPPPNFESCPETPIYQTPFSYPPTRTP